MITDRQSLYLASIVVLSFFIAGLANLLHNVIVQIIIGILYAIVVVNLFIPKKKSVDIDDSKLNDTNLFK
ncbi:hypothetical protein CLV86_2118 [Lacinutrix venerupis]|uniref:hypothetical protein n=1 Tax=Lacinutrix venerupis TaxID=1486034 RepID=UPI000EB1C45B|nr:hypothetical protein [Lacinutrix venerupis]RLJ62512.1 hypothetical protein CLV86_2118 [Lacinutrix venerupis]